MTLSCILLSFLGFSNVAFSAVTISPSRNISIITKDVVDQVKPVWMNLWEEARALSRIEAYHRAAELYGQLYSVKPSIEEATWEYCKVLIKIEDFNTVKNLLDGLLEQSPNRSDYLLLAGDVALHNREFAVAAQHFGKVFEKKLLGELSDLALQGFVDSLRAQGKRKFAFPLLEQLALRKPKDLQIVHNAARDAQLLGENRKALYFYEKLLQEPVVSDRIIFQAAKIYEAVGDIKNVIDLWLTYLKRHPDYLPFREKIVDHFIQLEKFEDVIVHLEYLINNIDNNSEYILRLGDIFLHKTNRPDRALYFYELYLSKHRDDKNIRQKVVDLQSVLANDFLSIVENDGAWLLWRDLAAIAPNRLAIYLEMAEILKKKGKILELIEILTIIFKETEKKDEIAIRIAHNSTILKDYQKALAYYNTLSAGSRTKKTYLLKADVEQKTGRELQELESRFKALQYDHLDSRVLKGCLILAGKLGLVEKQVEIFNYVFKNKNKYTKLLELIKLHLHYLSVNFMVTEYEKVYEWAQRQFQHSPQTLTQLAVSWTDTLRVSGRKRKAEGVLRNMLHTGLARDTVLLKLAENSVEDGKLEEADEWLKTIQDIHPDCVRDQSCPVHCRLVLLKAKGLVQRGQEYNALTLLTDQLKISQNKSTEISGECETYQIEKEIAKLHFQLGNYVKASQYIDRLAPQMANDVEILVLRAVTLRQIDNEDRSAEKIPFPLVLDDRIPSSLLLLSKEVIKYKEYNTAGVYLNKYRNICPASVSGLLSLIELHTAKGEFTQASHGLASLAERFPYERYIGEKWIEIEMRLGEYEKAKRILATSIQGGHSNDDLVDLLISQSEIDRLVVLARIFWGNKDHQRALEIYERLLSPSMAELMSDQFDEKQIDHQLLSRDDNFWNSLISLLQSEPKVIEELMQPSFLLQNLNNNTGRIVSENFEEFSWHKLIQSEYLARNATYKRKYYYAEQSYKRLLKEQESTEGMLDLASIYERIGEYRKEAKIYEVFQSSGGNSPDLKSSIARSYKEISPQTSIDGTYLKKSGRDGYMDTVMTSLGVSFLFTPNLNMDMQYHYERRNYESIKHDIKSTSNVLTGETTLELGEDYELFIQAGIEKNDDTASTRLKYDLEVTGQLDNYLQAYLSIKNQPVTDNLYAIEEQIYYQAIGIGFNFETPIGLSIGGDYFNLNYDGVNSQQRYHWAASYEIFQDFSELVFKYDYEHLASDEVNKGALTEDVVLAGDTLYYWSPRSYSEQAVSVNFKHYYLGFEEQNRLTKNYYSLSGGIGYEDGHDLSYRGGFDIFFEMSQRFLLHGNFAVQSSNNYEEAELSISINYRW